MAGVLLRYQRGLGYKSFRSIGELNKLEPNDGSKKEEAKVSDVGGIKGGSTFAPSIYGNCRDVRVSVFR
jgi:hypothetical protein